MTARAVESMVPELGRTSEQLPARAQVVTLQGWRGREAVYVAPASGRARALAVELHGSGLDPLRQDAMSRLADRLGEQGVAVLLPQGGTPFQLRPDLDEGFAWQIPGAPLPGAAEVADADAGDVGYIADLVESFQAKLQLRDAPLFLVGYSGGARLASHLLGLERPTWSAAGLVAGLRPVRPGPRPPPPTVSFHGGADSINPFEGGLGARWDLGVEEAGRLYASAQGCAPGALEHQLPGARLQVHRTPDGRPALSMYAVAGGTHAWPGARDEAHLRAFGPGDDSLDASALIADLFVAQMDACGTPACEAEGRRRAG